MRDRLLSRILLGPLVFLAALAGCKHTVPTIPIVVIDAETKMPIPGAEVRLWSPSDNTKTHVEPSGTTGPDGIARIKAEYKKEDDVLIEVAAPDYLQDEMDRILAGKVPGAPAGGGIIEIFRGPRPVIELIIPTTLRGDLKIELKIQDATPEQIGKRTFRFAAPEPQLGSREMPVVHVAGPPVLDGRLGPEFRGLYPNLKPMPAEPKDNEIVLRWVRSEGLDQYFVVGTKVDQESARRAAEKNIGPRESSGQNKGGGGRKGGGGGAGGSGGGGTGSGGMGGGRQGFGANGVGGTPGY